LILYIMTFGMMFLLGMVKISQTDLVIRIVKIAFVSGLMNDSTFEFFNTYVFDFTTEFSDTIIANMSGYSLFSGSTSISNPMMFMNEVMTKIFLSSTFAAQIMALPAMGLNGVLYFILMIVCIGIIIIVLFRAIAIYLMAYMAIAVLIGISPLFLTFILFEKTRHLFDNWVKFTFRYMLEPVIMLAGIIILTQLFTIYLDYVIGYSVCWKCAIPIKIPFPSIPGISPAFLDVELFCFNWFAPWGFDHRSSQMGLSMQNMVVLLMIAYCLWGYIDFSASIVGRIAGGVGGPSATGMGQAMSGAAENSMLKKVGLDAESRAEMKKQAGARLESMRKGDKKAPLESGNRHDVEKGEGSKPDTPKTGLKSDSESEPRSSQSSSSASSGKSEESTAWKRTAPSTQAKTSGIQIGGRGGTDNPSSDSKVRQGLTFGSRSGGRENISVEESSGGDGVPMSEGAKTSNIKTGQPVGIVKKMVAKFEAMSNQLNKGGPSSEGTKMGKERSGIKAKVSDNSENEDL
ncbi:MAG: type IV secretion system protein, partial [Rickettsiaceae bacterium]|nr:type IV secretion system protein [Rickettsiaceae bacterium]